ncbi:alpha/beta hydrolase [soil metagenome]
MLLRLIIGTVIVYGALVVLAYLMQSRLVHLPNVAGRALMATPANIGLAHDEVWLVTQDGVRLHGWFVPAEGARGTVLFFHGNAGNISHRLESILIFHRLGLNVFIIDYRGYGRSEGRPSEVGLYRDAEASYRYLLEDRGLDPDGIVVFGRSLGGAVAAWTAANHRVAGVIVESGFISVPELGAELYPFLPVRLLSRLSYGTRSALQTSDVPILIVHSQGDNIIPYRHGLALYEATKPRSSLLTISGDHNSGFLEAGIDYTNGLSVFLDKVLGASG